MKVVVVHGNNWFLLVRFGFLLFKLIILPQLLDILLVLSQTAFQVLHVLQGYDRVSWEAASYVLHCIVIRGMHLHQCMRMRKHANAFTGRQSNAQAQTGKYASAGKCAQVNPCEGGVGAGQRIASCTVVVGYSFSREPEEKEVLAEIVPDVLDDSPVENVDLCFAPTSSNGSDNSKVSARAGAA